MTFREWIKSVGVDKISETLGFPAATIYSWSRRDDIPQGAWVDIVFKFAEIGLSDLVAMKTASYRAREAASK